MIAATSLFLLRHAEVEARYQRIFGGRIDMDLSPRGHEQAVKLAKYIEHKKFDAVYASPMKRVQQTMAPFIADTKASPIIMPGLREVDFGDWTGLGWEQVREKFNISAFEWLSQIDQGTMPNAETGQTFRARVEPCIQQILQDHPGQSVAIFCHGGVIRMLLSIILDLPLRNMSLFEIEYASLTEVQKSPHKTELQLLNFTPWRHLI
ncbi:histidine phosphatase family protein [Pedosphaera parvula]|uniref:Phosphoglycerate mutase n=1 Tax=Pedosphaera parvula (strain Ellin514) TaxID=320771 RepID=B9XR70_PEDPL|nr:histidine phosphatase family protein [Pedosphaera parvula]EEF57683.1 Phosphoglycerate mutase [Pedosphaera parvula Ellin514]